MLYSINISAENILTYLLFFVSSTPFGMVLAFKPDGIEVNGVLLRSDTATGNLNFYKRI